MTDTVALANLALVQVGAARVTDLSQTGRSANAVNAAYDQVRRSELEANIWTFARTRAQLSAETTTPAFEYGYQYVLPSDCLRLISIEGAGAAWYPDPIEAEAEQYQPFQIEGRRILTNMAAPINIKYVFDETVVANWSAAFTMMVGCRLAQVIAFDLSDTATLSDRLRERYYEALQRAALSNEIQSPASRRPASSWEASRGTGRYVPLATAS